MAALIKGLLAENALTRAALMLLGLLFLSLSLSMLLLLSLIFGTQS